MSGDGDDTVIEGDVPRLTDDEIALLEPLGERRVVGVDEYLYRAGDEALHSVEVRTPDGLQTLACSGLFSFIGADPSTEWLSGCAALDDHGFVLTDRALGPEDLGERWTAIGRGPLPYETSRPGLFAVGDVRSGSTKRVAGAVGEGSSAVRAVHEHLAFLDR